MNYAIFASYGNDSIALIQFAHEQALTGVTVAYCNTGWAADHWPARVVAAEAWARSLGFETVQIGSEGMESLVARKKAWPRGGGGKFQFCTSALKIEPSIAWLDQVDPDGDVTCMNGIRREESPNRALTPEHVEESEAHGGRSLWSPLVRHTEAMRNSLIRCTPFDVLPHRSKECSPCVNAQHGDLRALTPGKIIQIRAIEAKGGVNSKGNPRVMFSPARYGGAVGIDAVIRYANDGNEALFTSGCDGGWCGS